jgi:hypothetical protein
LSTKNPINTLPIQQFIQQVKTAETSKQKEVKLPIDSAKNLSYTLGIVLARLAGDYEELLAKNNSPVDEVITVTVDGGNL